MRQVTVPATIPEIDVVHSTSLTLYDDFVKQVITEQYIVVGQPLSAELTISHTRKWGTQELEGEMSFCFDVQADPEAWLIGGMRRCHFTAKVSPRGCGGGKSSTLAHKEQEDDQLTFPLLLVPQRCGHLVLPSVKVWAKQMDPAEAASFSGQSKAQPLLCETDHTTETKTILVMPNLGSTTICLDTSESGSAAWLLKSTPRDP